MRAVPATALLLLGALPAVAQHQPRRLTGAALEFPFQAPVRPAARSPTPAPPVPAAAGAHIITREQIRQSGAASIPEVLRLAPGVQVTQLGPGNWDVGLRGANGTVSGGLLVLMDGRSLYNPLFGDVFWRQYDLLVDEIERVEVIRGPGGTIWGGNAVNAVVNIVTARAREEAGTQFSAGATGPGRGAGALRHGDMLGKNASYRVYGKYGVTAAPGPVVQSSLQQWLVGGRLDWMPSAADSITLQADFLEARDHRPLPAAGNLEDGSLLARWRHARQGGGESLLQAWFDSAGTADARAGRRADTWDLDFQQRIPFGAHASFLFGAGYRHVEYLVQPRLAAPGAAGAIGRGGPLVQADFRLGGGLELSLGSRLESNTVSGIEYLPSARLLWRPGGPHTLWAMVFRDMHLPASAEGQGGLPAPAPGMAARIAHQAGERSGWELGYRGTPAPALNVDLALSHSRFEPAEGDIAAIPLLLGPGTTLSGDVYNIEGFVEWRLLEDLRMTTSYSLLSAWLDSLPLASQDFVQQELEWRAHYTPAGDVQLDAALLWVDGTQAAMPADHVRVDLRLGWAASSFLQFDLNLLNVFDHDDAGPPGPVNWMLPPPDFRRAVLGQLRTTW